MTHEQGPRVTAQPERPARAATFASDFSGLLLFDKPVGVTSHDVVDRVRKQLHIRGVGHLGTLDPGASGLLVLAMGAATRCAACWQGGTKTYEATIRFGVVTDSQDLSGAVLEEHHEAAAALTQEQLRAASERFVGSLTQVPPMVSALKHHGERLYAIARRGESVEREARTIQVHAWEWTAFELPEARATVRCSGGTYVRTLAHDLGRALGVGAALAGLRRVRSEPFGIERAVPLAALDEWPSEQVIERAGIELDRALDVLPAVTLDDAAAALLGLGGRPALGVSPPATPDPPLAVVFRDRAGRALALGERVVDPARPGRTLAAARVVFPWAVRSGPGRVAPASAEGGA